MPSKYDHSTGRPMEGTIWSPPLPTPETRYQRIGREQRERQAARAERMAVKAKGKERAARAVARAARMTREAKREKKYLDSLVSDHNHEMDG